MKNFREEVIELYNKHKEAGKEHFSIIKEIALFYNVRFDDIFIIVNAEKCKDLKNCLKRKLDA